MTRKALFIGILSFFICLILMGHLWAAWQITGIGTDSNDSNLNASSLMAIDSNNKAHIVYSALGSNYYEPGHRYVLRYATNITGAWKTYNLNVDCPLDEGCTLSAIAIDPYGYIHLVYEKVWDVYPRTDWCSYCKEGTKAIMYLKFRYYDIGYLTEKDAEVVYQYLADVTYLYPLSVTLDGNNKVHIAFLYCAWGSSWDDPALGDWLYYATNASGGWSGSVEKVPDGYNSYKWAGISPSIGVDSSGNVHISHVDWYRDYSSYGNL